MDVRTINRGEITKLQWKNAWETKWQTLSLGKTDKSICDDTKEFVSAVFELGLIPSVLLKGRCLPRNILDKLASRQIIPPTLNPSVSEHYDRFFEFQAIGKAPNTLRNMRQFGRVLKQFFTDRTMSSVTAEDVRDWFVWRSKQVNEPTLNREVRRMKQFFRDAVERQVITIDPARTLKGGASVNAERFEFVPSADVEKVMDKAANQNWRTIIALARFGGLRCNTEHCNLKWEHVDFEKKRITIVKHKTPERVIPMFPELRKELEAESQKGEFVVHTCRVKSNLDEGLRRAIRRAGLDKWPILWHGLRKTRQTELMQARINPAAVRYWMGNSEAVAKQHYEFATQDDFDKMT